VIPSSTKVSQGSLLTMIERQTDTDDDEEIVLDRQSSPISHPSEKKSTSGPNKIDPITERINRRKSG
jgi:hypothetical protein